MSIQSNINQSLALGAALTTQSPAYKDKIEKKIETKEIIKNKKVTAEEYKQTVEMVNKERENLAADKQALPEEDKNAKEVLKEINQREEVLNAIETGAKERAQNAAEKLALREGRLTNDYGKYLELKKKSFYNKALQDMEAANQRAADIKKIKREQNKKEFLETPTSLGMTIGELGLSSKQMSSIKKQIKRRK